VLRTTFGENLFLPEQYHPGVRNSSASHRAESDKKWLVCQLQQLRFRIEPAQDVPCPCDFYRVEIAQPQLSHLAAPVQRARGNAYFGKRLWIERHAILAHANLEKALGRSISHA
jgi:hypothetical protein